MAPLTGSSTAEISAPLHQVWALVGFSNPPTVTNTLIMLRRLAPIVRRMAMSRVLARTSMISDDRMLNTATSTISDRTTNIATRSTSSAWNSAEFI